MMQLLLTSVNNSCIIVRV